MATTLTKNLKLRVGSDLTTDSVFNLNKIDTLGGIYQVDTNQAAKIRSQTSISLLPNNSDIGGSGTGGTVAIGASENPVSEFKIYADSVNFSSSLSLTDTATSGTKSLFLKYKSDIDGTVDTTADRTLNIDPQASDRNIVLGGDFKLLNNSLTLTLPTALSWSLPAGNGSNGQVLSTDGAGTLSWENATASSLSGLTDVTLTSPTNGQILTYNGSEWINQSPASSNIEQLVETWSNADGTTKTITHNFNTRHVSVEVLDNNDSYKTIELESVSRPNVIQTILTATEAPTTSWTVLLTKFT